MYGRSESNATDLISPSIYSPDD